MSNIFTNRDADYRMLYDLRKMLEKEIQKPYEERNYELIDELTAAITDATIPQAEFEATIQREMMQQEKTIREESVHRATRFRKPLVAACACLVLLIGLNAFSIHATGLNLLQLTYSLFNDNVQFHYPSSESSNLQPIESANDPYGILSECEKNGFSPLVPQYLPEGSEMKDSKCYNTQKKSSCSFIFNNGNTLISLDYDCFLDANDLSDLMLGIPSDKQNIAEMNYDGTTVVTSKEDEQFTAYFEIDNIAVTLFTNHLDYTEAEKILSSFFT